MLLDDIADYLASQGGSGVGVVGTNLFKGYRPETPDLCLAIYETGGMRPTRAMTPSAGTVVTENPGLQLVGRSAPEDYQTVRTRMHNAFVLLDGFPERSINGTLYKYIVARQSIQGMGRDENQRVLLVANFDVVKALSTSTST